MAGFTRTTIAGVITLALLPAPAMAQLAPLEPWVKPPAPSLQDCGGGGMPGIPPCKYIFPPSNLTQEEFDRVFNMIQQMHNQNNDKLKNQGSVPK
jgi:hypothetical protein